MLHKQDVFRKIILDKRNRNYNEVDYFVTRKEKEQLFLMSL